MELFSDDVVRSWLGFLHEASEVDRPNAFPEPDARRSEELSLSDGAVSSSLSPRICPVSARVRRGSTHDYFMPDRSAGLPRVAWRPRPSDRTGGQAASA